MLKEAALFTVSTGILIYFISPVSEEKKVAPEKVENVEAAPRPVKSENDGWGYDDEDDVAEEAFVFGEPMVADGDEKYGEDEEGGKDSDEDGWDEDSSSGQSNGIEVTQNTKSRGVHPDSPKGSERGSKDNPVVFETNNPVDSVDD